MKKILVIPSYEPDEKLINLVNEIKKNKEKFEVVVINDGSSKEYNSIYKSIKNKVNLIEYKENQGKGYALKKGFKYIADNYKEEYVVITIDSDGQHKLSDAIKLGKYIEKNPDDLVLGKRLRESKIPFRSRFGNSLTRLIYKLSTGLDVYDTQTGLRAFSNKLIGFMLDIEGNRYEYEMNVLLKCAKSKIHIEEINIETIYIENNKSSHFNVIKDSFKVYKEIIKYSLSSILSFIIDYSLFSVFSIFINITISNIIARIISATFNFTFNKNIVFKSKKNIFKSALEYFLLASFILCLNTILLNLLINLGLNKYLSKIIVEVSLFTISFLVQRTIIFKKNK